jgi:hypothetical protein
VPGPLDLGVLVVRSGAGDLRDLSGLVTVTVVDGSPAGGIRGARRGLGGLALVHRRPDSDLRFVTGKVNGVWTALRRPGPDRLVIADDVR